MLIASAICVQACATGASTSYRGDPRVVGYADAELGRLRRRLEDDAREELTRETGGETWESRAPARADPGGPAVNSAPEGTPRDPRRPEREARTMQRFLRDHTPNGP